MCTTPISLSFLLSTRTSFAAHVRSPPRLFLTRSLFATMAGIPNLLIERPERDGGKTMFVRAVVQRGHSSSSPSRTQLMCCPLTQIFTHKGDSVDFKMQPCKQLEDGEWEMIESFEVRVLKFLMRSALRCFISASPLTQLFHPNHAPQDPETTGYMKVCAPALQGAVSEPA